MAGRLSSAITAASIAGYVGGCVFGFLAALAWALAHEVGFTDHAPAVAVLAAAPPSLMVALWFAKRAYLVERGLIGSDPAL